jgi:hypothetical protein
MAMTYRVACPACKKSFRATPADGYHEQLFVGEKPHV